MSQIMIYFLADICSKHSQYYRMHVRGPMIKKKEDPKQWVIFHDVSRVILGIKLKRYNGLNNAGRSCSLSHKFLRTAI